MLNILIESLLLEVAENRLNLDNEINNIFKTLKGNFTTDLQKEILNSGLNIQEFKILVFNILNSEAFQNELNDLGLNIECKEEVKENSTMKTYLVKETENNKMFRNDLIGLTLNGVLKGEYVELDNNGEKVLFLLSELVEGAETNNDNVVNKSILKNELRYIRLYESNNNTVIVGIKDYKKALENNNMSWVNHIIIYNSKNGNIIYNVSDYKLVSYAFLCDSIENILLLIENSNNNISEVIQIKHNININHYISNFNDFFSGSYLNIYSKLVNKYLEEQNKQLELNTLNSENETLENELIALCDNKDLKYSNYISNLYIVNFKDKRCNELTNEFIYNAVNEGKYNTEYKIIYNCNDMYNSKYKNEALKNAIKIVSNY